MRARETPIETPLGRARWILATSERGTAAEVAAFDALLEALLEAQEVIAFARDVGISEEWRKWAAEGVENVRRIREGGLQ